MLFRGLSEARFDVLDINGNLCLQGGGSCENFQKKRIVRDPASFHMLTICEKMSKRLDFFLANIINGDISNFQVVGCYSSQSCKVHRGDAMIAEVNHRFLMGKFCEGKVDSRVKVYPGLDYAFIALFIILE
ncbi:protein LURP-one-related [Salix suchowensis]|nr:protein LURP-one-related [Salix suchowensis]